MSAYHEQALIGMCCRHQEVFDRPDFPLPGHFDNPLHRKAVAVFSLIRAKGLNIDWITIHDHAPDLVVALTGGNYDVVSSGNEKYYIREVKQAFCRREITRLIPWLQDQESEDPQDILDLLSEKVVKLQQESGDLVEVHGKPIEEILEKHFNNPEADERIPTGFSILDNLLEGGFPLGSYVVGTGPTGHGKSTLAGQMVLRWVYGGRKVWFGSFEIAPTSTSKILMIQAGLAPVQSNISQLKKITKGNLFMSGTLGVLNPEAMAREIQHFIGKGIKIFVIDNLSVMEAIESGERYEKQVKLMQQILRLSMEHGVLFLILAHLRKGVQGKPTAEDITGAGLIGQLAAAVWMVTKVEGDDKIDGRISLLKTRTQGMGKSVRLSFNAHSKTYTEVG